MSNNAPAAESISVSTEDFLVVEALRTRAFWLVFLVATFCFAAEQMVLVHAVPYSGTLGISATQAAVGLSFSGVGIIISRAIIGALSDRIGRVPSLVLCCGIEAVAIFCLLAVRGPLTLYLAMLVFGFGYGGWGVVCAVILGDYYGSKNLGTIIGIWFTCGVPGGVLGPLMGAIVFDVTRSYFLAIIIAGTVCVVAVVLAAFIRRPQKPSYPIAAGNG